MMRVESLETQLRGFETAKKRLRLRLTRAEREANDLRKVNETRMRENTRLRADAEQLEVLHDFRETNIKNLLLTNLVVLPFLSLARSKSI